MLLQHFNEKINKKLTLSCIKQSLKVTHIIFKKLFKKVMNILLCGKKLIQYILTFFIRTITFLKSIVTCYRHVYFERKKRFVK